MPLTRPPAEVGMPLEAVDTPSLIVDLDVLEANLSHMAQGLAGSALSLRPHAKSHKCGEIARRQVALGAVGVCCQKVSEAEAMVEAGVSDVLIANEVVGDAKLRRLAALARHARMSVCVDSEEMVQALQDAMKQAAVRIGVLVEIDTGEGRAGAEPGEPAARLAARVAACPNLAFRGLQAYRSVAQHARPHDERHALAETLKAPVDATRRALQNFGLPCETISGGGTGTWDIEAELGILTELQAGSYVFMDANYSVIEKRNGGAIDDFEVSLFVLSTAMSEHGPARGMLDAGRRAVCVAAGLPRFAEEPALSYVGADDEHGRVRGEDGNALVLGRKYRLIPSNCDSTVNLHDWLIVIRKGHVEAVWPVEGRGAYQ